MGRLPRVIFFGTESDFSPAPLAALLAAEVPVAAVVMPARPPAATGRRGAPNDLPVLSTGGLPRLRQLASDHCIPLLEVPRASAAHPELAALEPDLLCVACFPWRLPSDLLDLPRHGALNVHPSLLPAYRGPAPLFWQFRNGETTGGVTVHWMTERFDAGDVAAQAALAIPEGISGAGYEARCARLGGDLLVEVIRAVAAGTPSRQPQHEIRASAHAWPRAEDFRIPTTLPARHAFNFLRAAVTWGQPVVATAARDFPIHEALSYSPTDSLHCPYELEGDHFRIQFSPGTVFVR